MKFLSGILLFTLLLASCRTHKPQQPPKPPAFNPDSIHVEPYAYFRFEKKDMVKPAKAKNYLARDWKDPAIVYNQSLVLTDSISPVGSCWKAGNIKTRQTIIFDHAAVLAPQKVSQFTWEVALRFDPDSMDNFRMGFAQAQVSISPSGIVFALVDSTGKADKNNRLTISGKLAAAARQQVYDGQWHHFAFRLLDTHSGKSELQLWIDGGTSNLFKKEIPFMYSRAGSRFMSEFLPKDHSTDDCMDELGIWNTALSNAIIVTHSLEFFSGEHYHMDFPLILAVPDIPPPMAGKPKPGIKSKAYAPGYPDYSVSQLEQLQTFPLPRYKPGTNLQRNFPWFDFIYLAYDYSLAETDTSGKLNYPGWKKIPHADNALAIDTEMYYHWHYFFNIPSPTYQAADFSRPQTISGKLTKYADQHPEIQTSAILFWTGINPSHAGYESARPYIRQNASIDPCADTTYPLIVRDGLTQRKNLELVMKNLPHRDSLHRIDFINENGEVFGESRTPNAEGYSGQSLIRCIQHDSSTRRFDRAKWQYKVFSTYRDQFAGTKKFPSLEQAEFSFYQVSGMLPKYYSEWRAMKKINLSFSGNYYSTPDFYPGTTRWEIWETHGPYHGLDVIKEGRKYEISCGDPYFSPFVCAGWFADSLNFRPAEWLASLKALGMMGAEFYYPAYFNTANPNKKQPEDPRGYIYQVAMPAYAQAITSRYEDIFKHSADFVYERNYDRLLIYRADTTRGKGKRFAVCTALLQNKNSTLDSVTNNVRVGDDELRLNFPVQGAVYIYDKTDPANVVFYQLDGWHEASHPYYWSKDFLFEAEVSDDSTQVQLHTERPAGALTGDYTRFTTYASFADASITHKQLSFHFEPRNDTGRYYIWVRARSAKEGTPAYVKFSLDGGAVIAISGINSGEFKWYCYKVNRIRAAPDVQHELRLIAADKNLELDKILLSESSVIR